MPRTANSNERPASAPQSALALVFAVAGSAALLSALLHDRQALALPAGIEGSLTVVIVGMALALAEGVTYRTVALSSLVIVLLQFGACRVAGEPFLAIIGIECVLLGLAGLVVPARSSASARLGAAHPASAHPAAARSASAHPAAARSASAHLSSPRPASAH